MSEKTAGMRELEECGWRLEKKQPPIFPEQWYLEYDIDRVLDFVYGDGHHSVIPTVYADAEFNPCGIDAATAHAIWLRLNELDAEDRQ